MKNAVFWDVTPWVLVRTDVLEEYIASIIRSLLRLLVTANVVPISPILVTLMTDMIHSSEASVLTRVTPLTAQKTAFFIVTAVKTSNLT
jgi:DNA polymerase III psi subunit